MPELLDPREQHFRIPSSQPGLLLFLRHLPPADAIARGVVLYVHWRDVPVGSVDRSPLRWPFVARRTVCRRLSCLGIGLSRLWPFGSVSRHVYVTGWTRAALHGRGRQPATLMRRALHLHATCDGTDFHHRALLGHDCGLRLCCTMSTTGEPTRVVRPHRPSRSHSRSGLSGVACRFVAGSVAALHRRSAERRIAGAVAPPFRGVGRALSG